MDRRLVLKILGLSFLSPGLGLSALDSEGSPESARQCLNRISATNSFEVTNFDRFVYQLRAYEKSAGTIIIDREKRFLDFDLSIQYPLTPTFIPDALRKYFGDPRYPYNVHARFEDTDQNTHVQTERGEKYVYKKNGGIWKLHEFEGVGERKREELEAQENIFSGKPLTYWIDDVLFGKNISEIDTFFFGLPYYGAIPFQKISDEDKRVDISMKNFWVYQNNERKSLYEDEDVIIGDISALFRKNVPVCAAIKIIPDTPKFFRRVANLELILQS